MSELTFSSRVKRELCSVKNTRDCCKKAECYGAMLFFHSFRFEEIAFKSDYEFCADRFKNLAFEVLDAPLKLRRPTGKSGLFSGSIDGKLCEGVLEFFFHTRRDTSLCINRGNLDNECCASAFLRGAFLSSGSVTSPEKEYHLEFKVAYKRLANDLVTFIGDYLTPPKITTRKSSYVVYYKDSAAIEDILTFMGGQLSAMDFMQAKMLKEMRNNVNRTTNCLTANISKTLSAVSRQKKAIEIIEAAGGLELLPPALYEVALLRKENEDASLSELCEMMGNNLSRSGLNHRLEKIIGISEEIQAKKSENRDKK